MTIVSAAYILSKLPNGEKRVSQNRTIISQQSSGASTGLTIETRKIPLTISHKT